MPNKVYTFRNPAIASPGNRKHRGHQCCSSHRVVRHQWLSTEAHLHGTPKASSILMFFSIAACIVRSKSWILDACLKTDWEGRLLDAALRWGRAAWASEASRAAKFRAEPERRMDLAAVKEAIVRLSATAVSFASAEWRPAEGCSLYL